MNRDELYTLLLNLISQTSPNPTERRIIEPYLPKGGTWDDYDNYIYEIGNSETLFAAHMDTVGKTPEFTHPVYKNSFLFSGNNTYCLGGDDRCGIFCLLSLIDAKVPGTYIFHNCEERGAVGATFVSKNYNLSKFKRAIEFDRRGINSLITVMSFDSVCSPEFASALIKELNLGYKKDPTGSFTDVYQYIEEIPEVTNLSVGYFNEHTGKECIAALWLIDYFIPSILKVNWENLPTVRDPKDIKRYIDYGKSVWGRRYNSIDTKKNWGDEEDWNIMLQKEEKAWSDYKERNNDDSDIDFIDTVCSSCETEYAEYFKGTTDDDIEYWLCEKCEQSYQDHIATIEEFCLGVDDFVEEEVS